MRKAIYTSMGAMGTIMRAAMVFTSEIHLIKYAVSVDHRNIVHKIHLCIGCSVLEHIEL